uniref:Uncharacterized protein n=1 Tax=Rhizophora mucronata TaxID=61149 RepID=A0A2P2IXJ3_RHIMU
MTLEMMTQSFRLLIDLDTRFPRAHSLLAKKGKSDLCGLKADEKVWCPLIFTSDVALDGRVATGISSSRPLHSSVRQNRPFVPLYYVLFF